MKWKLLLLAAGMGMLASAHALEANQVKTFTLKNGMKLNWVKDSAFAIVGG